MAVSGTQERRGGDSRNASTGIAGLDDILHGGFTADRLYLIQGNPGSGKTTLAMQFLREGVRQKEPVLYVTLSETREELAGVAHSHGWSLDGLEIIELIPSGDSLLPDAQMRMFHPSEVELGQLTRQILSEVERLSPARVVFDSLSEMRLLAQNALHYRRQILALKQFFHGRGCTVLLLDDLTADSSDSQLESLAHGVVDLEHVAQEYGSERRRLRVLKMRGKSFRGGYHDFKIRTGGLEIYPRLVAAEHKNDERDEILLTGDIGGLDLLLGGGITRGTSVLVLGPAGTGKSSLAIQFITAAMKRGEKTALFAFDESLTTLRIRSRGLGMDIDPYVENGSLRIQQVDPAELSPGEFSHLVRKEVDERDAKIVVLDSLNGYINAMPEERFLTLHLHELLTYLGQKGVVTFLVVAQAGIMGSNMLSPVDASYLADTVILFRFFESFGRIRRAISVIKKRTGKHEDTLREVQLNRTGLQVGEPLSGFQGVFTGTPSLLRGEEPLPGRG